MKIEKLLGLGIVAVGGYFLYKNWGTLFGTQGGTSDQLLTPTPTQPSDQPSDQPPTQSPPQQPYQPPLPSDTPPSRSEPCPPPATGVQPNCICPNGQLWDGTKCVSFPMAGVSHCEQICKRYRFCNDADVQTLLNSWVQSRLTDAEIAVILDCWVKTGKCSGCP